MISLGLESVPRSTTHYNLIREVRDPSAIFIEMKGRFWQLFNVFYIYKEVELITQSNLWSTYSMKERSGMNVEH